MLMIFEMNPEPENQQAPQQSGESSPQPSGTNTNGGMRVIQPLSQPSTAIDDDKPSEPPTTTEQPAAIATPIVESPPQPAANQATTFSSAQATTASPAAVSSSPVTPASAPAVTAFDHTDQPADKGNQLIKILVILIGLLLAVPAALSLLKVSPLLSFGGSVASTSALAIGIDIIYVLVGIGLILRQETARLAYIFLALLTLLLLVYGTVLFITDEQRAQAPADSSLRVQLQYDVSYCLSQPPSVERDQIVKDLQTDIGTNQQPAKTCNGKLGVVGSQLVKLIPAYLVAILPLIVLTRRPVKAVFK